MKENLTDNELAYEIGQEDAQINSVMISYSDWVAEGWKGSHSAYEAGFQDYIDDQYPEED